jgi:hypothetical protein
MDVAAAKNQSGQAVGALDAEVTHWRLCSNRSERVAYETVEATSRGVGKEPHAQALFD